MFDSIQETHGPEILVPMHTCDHDYIFHVVILADIKGTELLRIELRLDDIIEKLTRF